MTSNEWLLECLAEECAEVAQRACKANRFGLHEIQPGQDLDNTERLMGEIWDLVGVITLLQDRQLLPGPLAPLGHIEKKKEKLEKYLAYAKDIGVVRDSNHLQSDSWARKPAVHPDGGWKPELLGRYEVAPCDYVSPHHGDLCDGGRVQSPNAQFTRECPKCGRKGAKPHE